MKITTKPANLTARQSRHMLDNGRGVQEVLVDGELVGQVAKNKHGIWIGHFDRVAMFAPNNPFVEARLSHKVRPSCRGERTKADVVKDVAAQRVGAYQAEIQAAIAAREEVVR